MTRSPSSNPKAWYREHVDRATDRSCGCSHQEPGTACDDGQALFRVSIQHGAPLVRSTGKAA